MQETNETRTARHRLQELSCSDPAAVSMLLTGRRGRERDSAEPNIQAGFRLTAAERDILSAAAVRLRMDVVHLTFDVDDPAGPPIGIVVIRSEGDEVACYPRCALWSPTGAGRVVIVPLNDGPPSHFVLRRGKPMVKVAGWPARSLDAGLRRGGNALFRHASAQKLRNAHVGMFREIVCFNGPGDWSVRTDRIAA